jgi:cellobiose phosphorylase
LTTPAGPAAIRERRSDIAAELRNDAGLSIELLANGSVFAIRHGSILVNQVLGSPIEGGLGNLYLRRRTRAGVAARPILGPASSSCFRASGEGAAWEGSVEAIEYTCTLRLAPTEPTWFWTLGVANTSRRRVSVDAVLAQDLGIAGEAAVRSSELYTSQYIDHTILEDEELGYLVCSRQNLPQGEAHPWIMHGCLAGGAGFLTDGFQFHGLSYRASNRPEALGRRTLPSRVYQYEFAFPTLQSRALTLGPGEAREIAFFAAYAPDHPAATSDADRERAVAARKTWGSLPPAGIGGEIRPQHTGLFDAPIMFPSADLGPSELDRSFGRDRRHEEHRDGTLLSFFHGADRHVVLRAKELVSERPTGLVMRSGRDLLPSDDTLSVTAWMSGVFASQLTIGNTSFNKLLSVARNPLNVLKTSGLRMFIRGGGRWELLGLPSSFEMSPNGARWIYRDARRTISVQVATSLDDPACRLTVNVERGDPLELLLCCNVIVGENEYEAGARVSVDASRGRVELRPAAETLLGRRYPEATFVIASPDAEKIETIGGDELLFEDGERRGDGHVVVKTKPVRGFSLVLTGSLLDAGQATARAGAANGSDAKVGRASAAFWTGLGGGPRLGGARGRLAGDLARLHDLLRWYLHDALIHLTTPHGLEQYSGAAWGLRDVCQGPVELLLATGNLAPARDVLRTVYEHQGRESGDWPQWFMVDRYREIRAPDSHADIIHWPIKALCDYVEASGDLSILDERVAWTDERTTAVTTETDTIFAHTEAQVERIERDCIPGTALPIFAGGDWEDTLQPADPAMARRMVSSWTVELAWQTLNRYSTVCERAGRPGMAERLRRLCARMHDDFNRHLIVDGIVAGLAHFGPEGVEYFLHPRDARTGVSYRLLPMTRGMIGGLFSPEQASRHLDVIRRHLSFPDGVRLMDRPMDYRGGTSRWFRRAESAANFGREIGLQYVHAHIRYVEAMATIGRPEEALRGLLAVCPIRIDLDVPSALPRQSNAYFSSSDGAFTDRYAAGRGFDRLRTGRVGVKGGWRVYSSGPGMYINQLISNVLGVRAWFDDVVIDPVLPAEADGLTFDFDHGGRSVRYVYRVSGDGYAPREVLVNGRAMRTERRTANPYRPGGVLIPRTVFAAALDRDQNVVEVSI